MYTTTEEARRLMGRKRFIGPELGLRFKQFSVEGVPLVHFSKAELLRHKHTHVLMFCPGVSTSRMWQTYPEYFLDRNNQENELETFDYLRLRSALEEKLPPGWRLVRWQATPESTGLAWNHQQQTLDDDEQVAHISLAIYAALMFRAKLQRLADADPPFACGGVRCIGGSGLLNHTPHLSWQGNQLAVGLFSKQSPALNIGLAAEVIPGAQTVENRVGWQLEIPGLAPAAA